MFRVVRWRDAALLIGALVLVAVATLSLQQVPGVSPTTVALALLLIVLGTATIGRLRIAIIVAVAGMLVFNFFFLPPLRTFTIADPENWIALFAFLVVAVIASNLSASAPTRTREAIARRNEVTRLFDLTRDVLLTTDTAGAIEAVARHVARRFELERVAVCLPADDGWRIAQGGSDELHIGMSTLDSAFARARGVFEFDARRADGGHARAGEYQQISIVPLRHGTNAVGLLVAVAPELDIGTLDAIAGVVAIAIERAQFLAERDAAELVRQKADLAATLLASLSHDLRTPLTAIKVAIENLRGDLPASERQAQAAAAGAEIDRLTRLVQDILDMAKVDAGAIQIDRQWVTASDVVDAAIAHVQHAVDGHPLDVIVADEAQVAIDPRLTSAALSHLLENAAQYSPVGAPIQVTGQVDQSGLSIVVTDRGPGLDPSELDQLFERFYRGRAARVGTFGTGMGLSITRGLLAAAGGRVWAENVPGAGARFSLVVPGAVRAVSVTE
jgi:two-component system sensor histidine kinase KdpD